MVTNPLSEQRSSYSSGIRRTSGVDEAAVVGVTMAGRLKREARIIPPYLISWGKARKEAVFALKGWRRSCFTFPCRNPGLVVFYPMHGTYLHILHCKQPFLLEAFIRASCISCFLCECVVVPGWLSLQWHKKTFMYKLGAMIAESDCVVVIEIRIKGLRWGNCAAEEILSVLPWVKSRVHCMYWDLPVRFALILASSNCQCVLLNLTLGWAQVVGNAATYLEPTSDYSWQILMGEVSWFEIG